MTRKNTRQIRNYSGDGIQIEDYQIELAAGIGLAPADEPDAVVWLGLEQARELRDWLVEWCAAHDR